MMLLFAGITSTKNAWSDVHLVYASTQWRDNVEQKDRSATSSVTPVPLPALIRSGLYDAPGNIAARDGTDGAVVQQVVNSARRIHMTVLRQSLLHHFPHGYTGGGIVNFGRYRQLHATATHVHAEPSAATVEEHAADAVEYHRLAALATRPSIAVILEKLGAGSTLAANQLGENNAGADSYPPRDIDGTDTSTAPSAPTDARAEGTIIDPAEEYLREVMGTLTGHAEFTAQTGWEMIRRSAHRARFGVGPLLGAEFTLNSCSGRGEVQRTVLSAVMVDGTGAEEIDDLFCSKIRQEKGQAEVTPTSGGGDEQPVRIQWEDQIPASVRQYWGGGGAAKAALVQWCAELKAPQGVHVDMALTPLAPRDCGMANNAVVIVSNRSCDVFCQELSNVGCAGACIVAQGGCSCRQVGATLIHANCDKASGAGEDPITINCKCHQPP
jgi:hypothetical protein